MRSLRVLLCISVLAVCVRTSFAEDLVEFLSGSKVRGKVLAIRKEAKEFEFQATIGGRTVTSTFAYDKVEAVTINGKRYVLNAAAEAASSDSTGQTTDSSGHASGQTVIDPNGTSSQHSRAEIERIIEEAGSTPPDWYEATPMQYPPTLDLSWPLKPQGTAWQANKYVFHYLWSSVYPNPGRWHAGAKLIHHILTLHQDNRTLLARDMRELGHFYFRLFQDYPRAAFWYRKSGVEKGTPANVHLAECYWRMGSKAMALEELKSRTVPLDAIKLCSDIRADAHFR